MADNKTRITDADPKRYLAAIEDEARRKDCELLATVMAKATRHVKMWGPSIVGFGSYHYKYESGREGDMCLVGFSSRKGDISVYGLASSPEQVRLLSKLGKHKMGKSCLYLRSLGDVDLKVLAQLVEGTVARRERRC